MVSQRKELNHRTEKEAQQAAQDYVGMQAIRKRTEAVAPLKIDTFMHYAAKGMVPGLSLTEEEASLYRKFVHTSDAPNPSIPYLREVKQVLEASFPQVEVVSDGNLDSTKKRKAELALERNRGIATLLIAVMGQTRKANDYGITSDIAQQYAGRADKLWGSWDAVLQQAQQFGKNGPIGPAQTSNLFLNLQRIANHGEQSQPQRRTDARPRS